MHMEENFHEVRTTKCFKFTLPALQYLVFSAHFLVLDSGQWTVDSGQWTVDRGPVP